jgi:plastocyanin
MKRWYWLSFFTVAIATLGYVLVSAERTSATQATGTARIVVKVMLTGTPKPGRRLQLSADPVCDKAHQGKPAYTQEVEVSADGALKNTLVSIDGVPGTYPAPSTPVVLDQSACLYVPHVVGVMVGQTLQILNSDPTLHNIHAVPVVNPGFNVGQPVQGLKSTRVFSKPEAPFHVKCDVHGWMSAYIGVFSRPFFGVSNDEGVVELKNLPAGTFQLHAWQETYGVKTENVTLAAGETRQITITFKAS